MPFSIRSSRRRYKEYRTQLLNRRKRDAAAGDASIPAASAHGGEDRKKKPRSRPFIKLLSEFWGLLQGYRRTLIAVLIALCVSTMLGLIPLYGTKIVFDSVLRDHPLPAQLPHWLHVPSNRQQLLTIVAVGMVLLAAASESIGLWSRWQTTRMTKRVQVSVRKKVFDHAVR